MPEPITPYIGPKYKHGQRVRYIGRTDRDFGVENGKEYTVFGTYNGPYVETYTDHGMNMDRPAKKVAIFHDKVSIYVSDPGERFGGVQSFSPDCFEPVK